MLALRIKKAVRNGATLVVADPRKIWLTKLAKRHLQLRPGTDVWLINAMMHTILSEGLQNEEYIRELTDDFDAVREVVMRYPPEEAEKVTGVPAEAIRATAREYASERHAAIFYTLGITEHACGVDNIWSLSNLVLMTGHLGYESTGLNALRGQNNVQGLNDSGANPSYLPGYQPVDDPEIRRKFSDALGRRGAGAARLPARPDRLAACTTAAIKALYLIGENPAQTEPNARHVEEGLDGLEFLMSQDIFLNDSTRKYAHVVLPASSFAEKDGTFTNTERRDQPRARRRRRSRARRRSTARSSSSWRRRSAANWPEYPDAEAVWNELADLSPNWYGIRYDRLEENGMQWPCTELDHPGTPYLHAPAARAADRTRTLLPGRVPAADRGARLRVPVRAHDRPHALPLQLGEHDDARAGRHGQAAAAVLRDPRRGRRRARDRRRRGRAPRLPARRGGGARRTTRSASIPGLVWMSLHFAEQKVNWLTHDVGDPLIGTPEYKVSAVRVEPIADCAPERLGRAAARRRGVRVDAGARRHVACRKARSSSPTTRPPGAGGSAAAGRRRREPRSSARCC